MVEMVREGTARGNLPNSGDFMEEFHVSRRTVARDLDFLRDEEKAPVVYDEAKWGYRLTEPSWSLPPVRLNRSEVFAFSIGRKLLSGFQGTPLELDMRSLFEKIAESLEGKVTIDPGALTEQYTVLGEDYVKLEPEMWTKVAKLTDRQEPMRVTYQKFDGMVKTYTLMPLHLV